MLDSTTVYSTMFALENNSLVSNRQILQVKTTRQTISRYI